MKTQPFYAALAHLSMFYGIVMDDNDFENVGITAWDKIGNKTTATYHYNGRVVDGELELPCNADIIEMITSGGPEWQATDNVQTDTYYRQEVENYIESRKTSSNSYYSRGGMIPYARKGDTLVFNKNIRNVHIIYKGVVLDEEGLPYLNTKEVEAIAAYCAYVNTNKQAMMTRDGNLMNFAQSLKQEWNRLCDSARTPIYLTQNDMDNILDVQSSWDRKRRGVSFKLYS